MNEDKTEDYKEGYEEGCDIIKDFAIDEILDMQNEIANVLNDGTITDDDLIREKIAMFINECIGNIKAKELNW